MRNNLKQNFSIIINDLINDSRLTAGAKGVACYLLSKPDGWKFYMEEIVSNFNESYSKIKKYIEELEDIGFLERVKRKNEKGQFFYDYNINENYFVKSTKPTPQKTIGGKTTSGKPSDGNPGGGNPPDGNPPDGNPSDGNSISGILTANNTNISNTDLNNTDKEKENIKEKEPKIDFLKLDIFKTLPRNEKIETIKNFLATKEVLETINDKDKFINNFIDYYTLKDFKSDLCPIDLKEKLIQWLMRERNKQSINYEENNKKEQTQQTQQRQQTQQTQQQTSEQQSQEIQNLINSKDNKIDKTIAEAMIKAYGKETYDCWLSDLKFNKVEGEKAYFTCNSGFIATQINIKFARALCRGSEVLREGLDSIIKRFYPNVKYVEVVA